MKTRALLFACALLLGLTPVMAQMPGEMPPPEHPVVVLGPPEGFQPPPMPPMPPDPEAGKQMMLDMFFQFMAGPDGVIDRGEFQAWVHEFHMPPPPDCDKNGDGMIDDVEARECGPMGPPPPECDFNGDGMVDEFEAEECKKTMGPPPECDFNGDGMIDEVEAEECKRRMPPPPECDFNRDGMVDEFEAEECKKTMGPPPECDFNGDGMIDEVEAEECKKRMPPPPECDFNGDGMIDEVEAEECGKHMGGPPPCSDELREAELMPQAEGVPCRERAGNLVFRTICNSPGYDMAAITLPGGRAASCFDIESMREAIEFEIVTETGDLIWEPGMGKEAFMGLKLDAGIYHIRSRGGSPEGAVTVRFVDVPVE